MSAMQIIFLIVAAVTLASAVMVVSTRKMLHAALWLILALFGVAVLFALLEAGFFAVVQVVVYIGAIAILMLFAIMLTRRVMADTGSQVIRSWGIAALVCALVLVSLVGILRSWSGFNASLPAFSTDLQASFVSRLGQALVAADGYVLPFEVASILLLAALIGSIYVAWGRK